MDNLYDLEFIEETPKYLQISNHIKKLIEQKKLVMERNFQLYVVILNFFQ